MDKEEARQILSSELAACKQRSFSDLSKLVSSPEIFTRSSETGAQYQLEIVGIWDGGREGENLRVIGSIDDGGVHAFMPLCEDFVIDANQASLAKRI